MKPVETKDSNVRLVLPEEEGLPDDQRRGDLCVERMFFADEETGDQRPGFESIWEPTDGERKALANGAPITLRLWGANHPPVNMLVGNPPEDGDLRALVTVKETGEAASKFFDALSKRMQEAEDIEPEEIPKIFEIALREVIQGRDKHPRRNGNG